MEVVDERLSRDFGGLVHHAPARIARADGFLDIVRAIEAAKDAGLPIACRGSGHSSRGQTLTGGVVLDMGPMSHVDVVSRAAVAGAGARLREVVGAALTRGLTLPVLPHRIDRSVGGVLSVGGIGRQSFRYGLVASNVEAITTVTGIGDVSSCTAERNRDLFDAVRGGLGQCAVIVEAKLKLVAAPERVFRHQLNLGTLDAALRALTALASTDDFDGLGASCTSDGAAWRFRLDVDKYLGPGEVFPASLLRFADAFDPLESTTAEVAFADYACSSEASSRPEPSLRYRPEMHLVLPAGRAGAFLGDMFERLPPTELANVRVELRLVRRGRIATPIVRWPDAEQLLLVSVAPAFTSQSEAVAFSRRCVAILGRARAHGALVYPLGFPVCSEHMSLDDWRAHFRWDVLSAAKKAFDPDGVLNPGLGVFAARRQR